MDALDVERDDPGAPLGRRPEDPHPRQLVEGGHRLLDEHVLVALDRVEPDVRDVVDRRAEADGLGDRRGPRLELVGKLVERRLVEPDRADHLAAEVERAHRLEQLAPAPQRADAARPAELVRGDGDEVGAERLHVDDAGAAPPARRRRP